MGIYIQGITIEMLRSAPLEAVEDLLASGDMVEVKEPHGRLIDADELINKHFTKWTCYDTERIGTTPTVIESEE